MKITQLTVQLKRLSSAEAELCIIVHVEGIDSTTQIHGFLTGPRCVGVESVQINYPIKPIPRPPDCAEDVLIGRVLIPEPNVWTTEMPFVYEGTVELWYAEKCADIKPIHAAFKGRGSGL